MSTVVVVERWGEDYESPHIYGVFESIEQVEEETRLKFGPVEWDTDNTRYRADYQYHMDYDEGYVNHDTFYATILTVGQRMYEDEFEGEVKE